MRRGLLSDYFEGVAVKTLSTVEANILRSNQHEFNSSDQLRQLLGTPDRVKYPATFIWIGGEQEAVSEDAFLTWYQSRKPPRSEHRLYFPGNAICGMANAGDSLFIAKRTDGSLMAIITPAESTVRSQLLWLFGLEEQLDAFAAADISSDNAAELDFTSRYILDELGIEAEEPEAAMLDSLIERFGSRFPTTKAFAELARSSLADVSPLDDPDAALMAWLDREEQMFRRLERHIVADRIKSGFQLPEGTDVDGFLKFSLSVQNRRKSRAGHSLELHLGTIFKAHNVAFSHGQITENRNRPDFLFPGQAEYLDPNFPENRLTMLGAKSTLKDRWRQVLSEAERIQNKHLMTLEPAISKNQTDEMRAKNLRLVLPAKLHQSYRPEQQAWLLTLADFLTIVQRRQAP